MPKLPENHRHTREDTSNYRSRSPEEPYAPVRILGQLYSHKSPSIEQIDQTIFLLSTTDALGIEWAAELAIEKAALFRHSESVFEMLSDAGKIFTKAQEKAMGRSFGKVDNISTKAKVFFANLPIYASIFTDSLPNEALAKKTFEKTVSAGHDLVSEFSNAPESFPYSKSTADFLNKLAVVILLQRQSINEQASHGWYPMFSTVSSSLSGKNSVQPNNSCDIEFFTNPLVYGEEVDPSNQIPVFAKLRVYESGRKINRPNLYEITDIPNYKLFINDDLRLPDSQAPTFTHEISSKIIEDCWKELINPENCVESTERLNIQEKLLWTAVG